MIVSDYFAEPYGRFADAGWIWLWSICRAEKRSVFRQGGFACAGWRNALRFSALRD
jgi:hypothetical protein